MKNKIQVGIIGSLILVLGSACASPGKRTGYGALGGGAGGAALGAVLGGWRGAAIGAGVGALAGGTIGNIYDKQAEELQQVADAKRTDNGVLVNLKNDLLFDTGKSDLRAEAVAQLSKLGDILAKYPEDRIQIKGYTDAVGSLATNEALSRLRAQSVRDVLAARGVKPAQMTASGYGKENPIASNKTAIGRAKNRRVELHIDIPAEEEKS